MMSPEEIADLLLEAEDEIYNPPIPGKPEGRCADLKHRLKEAAAALRAERPSSEELAAPAAPREDGPSQIVIDAYLGIMVLGTMCKKAGLSGGQEASDQLLERMTAEFPALPALSALRSRT